MQPEKAKSKPTTGVELVNADGDNLSPEERAELPAALQRGVAQAKAGKLIPADEVMSKLRSRR